MHVTLGDVVIHVGEQWRFFDPAGTSLPLGMLRWQEEGQTALIPDAKAPFFAPPAVAGETAYAADLKGVLHAINVRTGAARWKLDLSTDPAVLAPGMVYAGPVLHGGRIYVATCNLVGDHVNRPTAVVCIGSK